jgi:FlaA1/EpsC-like NDP-sugar epimerase
MIRLSSRRESESEIGIVYSGLRSGEKLHEELLADADQTLLSRHPRLRIAKLQAQADGAWADELLQWLRGEDAVPRSAAVRERLREFVTEYRTQ